MAVHKPHAGEIGNRQADQSSENARIRREYPGPKLYRSYIYANQWLFLIRYRGLAVSHNEYADSKRRRPGDHGPIMAINARAFCTNFKAPRAPIYLAVQLQSPSCLHSGAHRLLRRYRNLTCRQEVPSRFQRSICDHRDRNGSSQ